MHKHRNTWVALIGGAFLVTLSLSAAVGAPPTGTDGPRGQTVAAFVHELVFGADEVEDEQELVEGDENELEDEQLDEPAVELEGEGDPTLQQVEGSAHGECVSAEASDKTDETDPEQNHGEVVSLAARETCWEPVDEVLTDPELEQVEGSAHGECVAAEASDKTDETDPGQTHGEVVSLAARETCWEPAAADTDATGDEGGAELTSATEDTEASNADRGNQGNAPAHGKPAGNGGGQGRGGGRP